MGRPLVPHMRPVGRQCRHITTVERSIVSPPLYRLTRVGVPSHHGPCNIPQRHLLITRSRSNNATQPPLDWPVIDPYHERHSGYQLSLHVTSYAVDPTYNKEKVLAMLAAALRGFGLAISEGERVQTFPNIGYDVNKTRVRFERGPHSVPETI